MSIVTDFGCSRPQVIGNCVGWLLVLERFVLRASCLCWQYLERAKRKKSEYSGVQKQYICRPIVGIYMRVQQIQDNQIAQDARVTRLDWDTSAYNVTRAMEEYSENIVASNSQTWRHLDCQSLPYYGIISGSPSNGMTSAKAVLCNDDQTLGIQIQDNLTKDLNNPGKCGTFYHLKYTDD